MTTEPREKIPGKILTANLLRDGLVVFLSRSGTWTSEIDNAVLAREPQSAAALEQRGIEAEAQNIVTGAYLLDVERDNGTVRPLHIRERIRAAGPSVNYLAVARQPLAHCA